MLGLGGQGLRVVVSALCGVAGGVVVVFRWFVLAAGLRTCVCGGVYGEARVLSVKV